MTFPYPGPGLQAHLHNHTRFSDGQCSAEEMCQAAKSKGLNAFGLSDHFGLMPESFSAATKQEYRSWAMTTREELNLYIAELKRLQQKYNDSTFTLHIGLEVDYFAETEQETRSLLDSLPLEYRIGSCHYAKEFPIDHLSSDWDALSQGRINQIWEEYWSKMKKMIASGIFQIAAHLDLPKKYGFRPTQNQTPRALELLPLLKQAGMALEINTAGLRKPCRETYPNADVIAEARRQQIPLLYSADAHHTSHIALGYPESSEQA